MAEKRYCRCCLTRENLKNLRDKDEIKMKPFIEMIKDCFSIELIESGKRLSSMICRSCIKRLREAHLFKRQIETIQEALYRKEASIFLEISPGDLKREPEETDSKDHYLDDNHDASFDSDDGQTLKSETNKRTLEIKPRTSLMTQQKRYNTKDELPYKLDPNNLTCHMCHESFGKLRTLDRHMNVHFQNYICNTCGLGFVTEARLNRHIISHDVGEYPCKICKQTFRNKNILGAHMKVHKPNSTPFKCPQCKQRFANYYMRQKHITDIHGKNLKTYKCKLCSSSFMFASKLQIHIGRVHLQEKNHMCQECGLAFFSKGCLVKHMVKHTGVKEFKCSVCEKEYARRSTLREHMRIHNNDRRFACSACGKTFVQKCSLKSHLRVHEKE